MKSVILAAGMASRLKPLTDNTPKCLLKVGGKSILEMAIGNLMATTDSDIVIVTGYLAGKIKEFMGIRFPGLNITYVHNSLFQTTNNIYSLWLAGKVVRGHEMLMMDSDIIFDKRIISKLIASGFQNCLALKKHEVHDEEIKVKTDKTGRVLEISKEVKPSEAAGESIGIELFGKEGVEELYDIMDRKITMEKNVNRFYETAFQELSKNELYAVDVSEYVCSEIDTAEDLLFAQELLIHHC